MANTIKIKNLSDVNGEMIAGGTITPGMLIEQYSATQVRVHSTAAGNAEKMFAVEDELQGNTIDDNYSATNKVMVWWPGRGDIVNAILAQGQNITTPGTYLVSNADGRLKAKPSYASTGDVDVEEIVGVATEAVNATSAAARIKVRII